MNKTSPIPGNKTAAQCSVTIVYKAKIGETTRKVLVVWSKTLINHSLSISIDRSTCRIDLKPWPFWGKKGFRSLDVGDRRLDLFWDLRSPKFTNGGSPEPASGYHVALVSGQEVVLLLGDLKKKAYKRSKARPSLHDAKIVSKRENVFGKRSFSARVRFDDRRTEHDVVVENSMSGKDAEMWVRMDGEVVIHVRNLQWKFRGNEKVMVDGLPVQVFWNVHDWFFGGPGLGQALFMFKPGEEVMAVMEEEEKEGSWSSEDGEEVAEKKKEEEEEEFGDAASEFCFILCALCVRGEIK